MEPKEFSELADALVQYGLMHMQKKGVRFVKRVFLRALTSHRQSKLEAPARMYTGKMR